MAQILLEVAELARKKRGEPKPPLGLTPREEDQWRKHNAPMREPPRAPDYQVRITGKKGTQLTKEDAERLAELLQQAETLVNHPFDVEPSGSSIRRFRKTEDLDALPRFEPRKAYRDSLPDLLAAFPDVDLGMMHDAVLKKTGADSTLPVVKEYQLSRIFTRDPGAARIVANYALNILKKEGYAVDVKGLQRAGD